MKKIIVMIALLAVGCSAGHGDRMVLDVEVAGVTSPAIALSDGMEILAEAQLDKNGRAQFVLDGDYLFATLVYGRSSRRIYLERGQRTTVAFTGSDMENTFTVTGANAPIMRYLNEMHYDPILPPDYARPFEDLLALIDARTQDAIAALHGYGLDDVNPHFVRLEEMRIRYYYRGALLMYSMAWAMVLPDGSYNPGDAYYDTLCSLLTDDPQLEGLAVYREFRKEGKKILEKRERRSQGD